MEKKIPLRVILQAKERKTELNGAPFDYITFGCGARPLVMIQGLNTRGIHGAALPLAYMYRLFARDYTVYLFDRRSDARKGIAVREMATDLAMAMDTLGIAHADVFGVSQGGMIAQYLAIDRPDLVNKLVLAVTLSRNNPTVEAVIRRWIALAEQGSMRELVEDMAIRMYSPAYVKRYKPFLPLLTAWQKPKDVERFVILAESCLTCDTYASLDQIRCPVFVIGGRQDLVVSGDSSEEIAEKLGCRIHMYDDLGHAAYEEAKDFNQRVYDFLKEDAIADSVT